MSRWATLMATNYLLLKRFVETPFNLTLTGSQNICTNIAGKTRIDVAFGESSVDFYLDNNLIFSIFEEDTVTLTDTLFQVVSKDSQLKLKKIDLNNL